MFVCVYATNVSSHTRNRLSHTRTYAMATHLLSTFSALPLYRPRHPCSATMLDAAWTRFVFGIAPVITASLSVSNGAVAVREAAPATAPANK